MDSYYLGEKDGELNQEPLFPEVWEYWRGYSYANREYWLKKKGIKLPEEFVRFVHTKSSSEEGCMARGIAS